jgi:hypothetical protein
MRVIRRSTSLRWALFLARGIERGSALFLLSQRYSVMKKFSLALLAVAVSTLAACASTPKEGSAPAAAPVAAKPAVAATNISGTWTLNVETPMGARDMKLVATQAGEALTGSIDSPRGAMPITGTVKGNAVAFMMKVNAQGMDMQIDYAGTVEGDSMKGTAKFGDFGDGTFTGKKQ